jgi:hypothetical protein
MTAVMHYLDDREVAAQIGAREPAFGGRQIGLNRPGFDGGSV